MLARITEALTDVANIDQQPRQEGRSMSMMLVSK
jgi:translation initiation factor IF-3